MKFTIVKFKGRWVKVSNKLSPPTEWGVTPSPGGSAGVAIAKKSTSVNQGLSGNTVKGSIINV